MKQIFRKDQLVVLLTLVVVALPLLTGVVYVAKKHVWAQNKLAEIEPRYARFAGIEASQKDLFKARENAQALLSQYVYSADKEVGPAGNDVQQKVRDVFSAAGLAVGSSQVVAPKTDSGFDRLELTVKTEGELASLQAALVGLEELQPAIFVDDLKVTVMGTPKAEVAQKLTIEFSISALRVHK